jgi:hypothetical protein
LFNQQWPMGSKSESYYKQPKVIANVVVVARVGEVSLYLPCFFFFYFLVMVTVTAVMSTAPGSGVNITLLVAGDFHCTTLGGERTIL